MSTPLLPGLDPARCRRRNRLAARRGTEAAPLRFLPADPLPPGREGDEAFAQGRLPKSPTAALSLINALRPGKEPLDVNDVWLHYAEAANDNFVEDRFLFLDATTLKNIARDAAAGVAFMNSHRTGGLSTPTELPFGRTFAGRYEEHEDRTRSLVGFYMLRNLRPNGDGGPSTDDLHALIDGGTLFDVSVGLYGGLRRCDVCRRELVPWYDQEEGEEYCPHLPGSTYAMTETEQAAQKQKGVPNGACSYSLVDARMGELSGVYDGAVPQAGFVELAARTAPLFAGMVSGGGCRQALALARGGGEGEKEAARAALAVLLGDDNNLLSEAPPAGASLAAQLDAALAAVRECVTRGREVHSLRSVEGRNLCNWARWGEFERLREALDALLRLRTKPVESQALAALQAKALALRAGRVSPRTGVSE